MIANDDSDHESTVVDPWTAAQIARADRGREPSSAASAQCRVPFRSAEGAASDFRPVPPRLALSVVAGCSGLDGYRQAGHGGAVASARFQGILALEVSKSPGPATDPWRSPRFDPRSQPGESLVGRTPDPWRAFEARDRGGSNDRGEVHGPGSSPAFAILEHVSPKPRGGHCFNRFLRCSNGDVQAAIRVAHHTPWTAQAGSRRCHRQPDGRLDRPPDLRGVSLGHGAQLSHP